MWASELNKAILHLLPVGWRGLRMMAWVEAQVSGFHALCEALKANRLVALRNAWMTPQVKMMEQYLNDRYEVTTIEIVDGGELGPYLVRDFTETDLFYLEQADSYVWSISDVYDFIVKIPDDLSDYAAEIAAIVTRFKLPGKRFMILIIITEDE